MLGEASVTIISCRFDYLDKLYRYFYFMQQDSFCYEANMSSYWFCQFQSRFNNLGVDSWIIGYTCLLGLVTSFVHCWTGSSSINSVLTSMVCKKNWHVSIVVSHSLNHLNLKIISYQNWMLFAIYNIMMIYFDRCARIQESTHLNIQWLKKKLTKYLGTHACLE